jgi:hypothetical protein
MKTAITHQRFTELRRTQEKIEAELLAAVQLVWPRYCELRGEDFEVYKDKKVTLVEFDAWSPNSDAREHMWVTAMSDPKLVPMYILFDPDWERRVSAG